MAIPIMTLPEMIFGVLVLMVFAAFIVTLAGVHLYTSLARPTRRAAQTVASPAASTANPRRSLAA